MSVFSQLLSSLIQQSNCSLPYLSQHSGLSSALIYKFRAGSRLPKSEEQLATLLPALRLTEAQRNHLLEEYRIEKLGRDRYRIYMEIKDVLENMTFSYSDFPLVPVVPFYPELNVIYKGEASLNSLIRHIIDQECSLDIPIFHMVISASYTFLNKYIAGSCSSFSNKVSQVHHVLSLLPASDINADHENLKELSHIIPFISTCPNYEPRYVYGSDNACQPYPYFLLTSNHLLMLSTDLKTGILHQNKAILAEYSQAFQHIWDISTPFINKFSGEIDYLKTFLTPPYVQKAPSYMLSTQPCLLHHISIDVGIKHLAPRLRNNPLVMQYLQNFYMSSEKVACNIYTLDGVTDFLMDGHLYELPNGSYIPFSNEEAMKISKEFVSFLEDGREKGFLLKPNLLNLPLGINCYAYPDGDFFILWQPPTQENHYFLLRERNTACLFIDFLQYLTQSRSFTYSTEESLARLKQWIE